MEKKTLNRRAVIKSTTTGVVGISGLRSIAGDVGATEGVIDFNADGVYVWKTEDIVSSDSAYQEFLQKMDEMGASVAIFAWPDSYRAELAEKMDDLLFNHGIKTHVCIAPAGEDSPLYMKSSVEEVDSWMADNNLSGYTIHSAVEPHNGDIDTFLQNYETALDDLEATSFESNPDISAGISWWWPDKATDRASYDVLLTHSVLDELVAWPYHDTEELYRDRLKRTVRQDALIGLGPVTPIPYSPTLELKSEYPDASFSHKTESEIDEIIDRLNNDPPVSKNPNNVLVHDYSALDQF
jgi:hypothetical protein